MARAVDDLELRPGLDARKAVLFKARHEGLRSKVARGNAQALMPLTLQE